MQNAGASAAEVLEKLASLLEKKPPKGKRRTKPEQAAIKAAAIDACDAVRELGPGIVQAADDDTWDYVVTWQRATQAGQFYKCNPAHIRAIARRCSKAG